MFFIEKKGDIVVIFKQSDLEGIKEASPWCIEAVKDSETVVTAKGFPCTFGTQGHRRKVHYLSFLSYPYSPKELFDDIKVYLEQINLMDGRESGLSGLLVFFEPLGDMSIHSKQVLVWNLLTNMKELYDKEDRFEDPKSEDYSFNFLEEMWFINFSSNSYSNRHSRNLNSFITLALQTFSKSDQFFKSNNKVKAKAQQTVRTLAEKFDGCPVHSGLGPIIGDEEPSPIKYSYFIGDTNEESSFEPWNYKNFVPNRVVIDGATIKNSLKEFEQFINLELNFPISVIGSSEEHPTLKSHVEFINIDQVKDYLKEDTLLVSCNADFLEEFRGLTNLCFKKKDFYSDKVSDFHIAYFNDLLALYC